MLSRNRGNSDKSVAFPLPHRRTAARRRRRRRRKKKTYADVFRRGTITSAIERERILCASCRAPIESRMFPRNVNPQQVRVREAAYKLGRNLVEADAAVDPLAQALLEQRDIVGATRRRTGMCRSLTQVGDGRVPALERDSGQKKHE
jgi:hypothetical protein